MTIPKTPHPVGSIARARAQYAELSRATGVTPSTIARLGVPPTATPARAVEIMRERVGADAWALALAASSSVEASTILLRATIASVPSPLATREEERGRREAERYALPGSPFRSRSSLEDEPGDEPAPRCAECDHDAADHAGPDRCKVQQCGCVEYLAPEEARKSDSKREAMAQKIAARAQRSIAEVRASMAALSRTDPRFGAERAAPVATVTEADRIAAARRGVDPAAYAASRAALGFGPKKGA